MRNLVIVGNGGFAREIEWLVSRINQASPEWNLLGFVAPVPGKEVIGDDAFLMEYEARLNVVFAIGNPEIRRKLASRYRVNRNLEFPNLIDPGAVLSDRIRMGMGNIVCAGTILTVDIEIGDFNIINLDCTVGHDAVICDYVTLNPSVNVSGSARICSMSNIGTGTQIIQGLEIGYGAVVGAGAVVSRSLPARCVAVGVPARPVKEFGGKKNEEKNMYHCRGGGEP